MGGGLTIEPQRALGSGTSTRQARGRAAVQRCVQLGHVQRTALGKSGCRESAAGAARRGAARLDSGGAAMCPDAAAALGWAGLWSSSVRLQSQSRSACPLCPWERVSVRVGTLRTWGKRGEGVETHGERLSDGKRRMASVGWSLAAARHHMHRHGLVRPFVRRPQQARNSRTRGPVVGVLDEGAL